MISRAEQSAFDWSPQSGATKWILESYEREKGLSSACSRVSALYSYGILVIDPFCIKQDEYLARLETLRRRMREQKLDAILLGTGMNLQYFSGFPSPQRSVSRPFFLLIPAKRDPILLSHTGVADECKRFSVIDDVRAYEGLSHAPVKALGDLLAATGVQAGRVGMELGFEQTLDISFLDFNQLRCLLPGVELVDVADLLWSLRWIKSDAEISCVRKACAIVADSYSHTFKSVRVGMTEREIYQTMQHGISVEGGDIFLAITSGAANYDLVSKSPEDRIVHSGEMVWMDAGCRVSGYWSDYSRAGVLGQPSDQQKRAQEEILNTTAAAISAIRPGVKCSELARLCLDRLAALPLVITSSVAARAGRIGHGIGLNMTEPPHLSMQDDTPLAVGMVVSVEPGIATEYGTFHVEEDVVVREDGCEVLSTSPRELLRLG